MNINALRDADNDAGFYVAATSIAKSWPGSILYQSSDGGASYQTVASFAGRATVGRTSGVLGDYQGGNTVDEINSVSVFLSYGTLSSTTYSGLMEGLQAALIGDEVVLFREASLIATNTYMLRGFLRGQRGTEAGMAAHVANERFVLLTSGTVKRIAQNTSDIGKTRLYKMVTSGATLSSAIAQSFTNTGAALKPYAPVHVGGGRGPDGSIMLSWVRRGRLSGEWRDNVDVPLSELSEAYQVEILSGSTVVRAIDTTTTSCIYAASDQVADFGALQSAVSVMVYQMSQVVGRGYPALATI